MGTPRTTVAEVGAGVGSAIGAEISTATEEANPR